MENDAQSDFVNVGTPNKRKGKVYKPKSYYIENNVSNANAKQAPDGS